MAAQRAARLVEDERPIAVRAGLDVAAVAAQDDRRGAAAVDDEDRLLVGRRVEGRQSGAEAPGQQPAIALAELLAEVDDLDGWRLAGRSRREADSPVRAIAGTTDAVDGRRRAAENDRCTGQLPQADRRVPGLEARRPVALV